MARPYTRGSKQFVFRAGGDHRSVSVGDPQEAYEAFAAFFGDGTADTYVIEDRPASQSLMLLPGRGAIARVEGTGEARTEYLKVEGTNRYLPSTLLFFEDGCGGLDHYGQWFPERRPGRVARGARRGPRRLVHDRGRGYRGGRPDLGGFGHRRSERPVLRLLRLARYGRRSCRTGRIAHPGRVPRPRTSRGSGGGGGRRGLGAHPNHASTSSSRCGREGMIGKYRRDER